jgi:outer membrane protein TolC
MTRFGASVRSMVGRGGTVILLGLAFCMARPELLAQVPPPARTIPPEEAAPVPRSIPDDGLSPPAPAPASAARPRTRLPEPAIPSAAAPTPIDLPYALGLVNASNPTIALARERVNEAIARQQQAAVLWVPNTFLGGNPDAPMFLPTFYHHDGPIQNAEGLVFDTVKSNLALQTGASLNLSLTDAIFAPRIARQATAAAAARSRVVTDDVQLDVALAYLDLLRAFGALAINAETLSMSEEMLRFAIDADRNGLGKTTADANRARTEVENRKRERIDLEGQAAVASARLTQLLLMDATLDLVPMDRAVVPITLVNTDVGLDELIATSLLNRPELAESRALVRQALTEWRANKIRPLLPTLSVAYYSASFQGGDPGFHNTGYRDDLLATAGWQLRNGGLGDLFRVKESRARYNEATLHVLEVQAQVAADVTAAAKLTMVRVRTLRSAQEAVSQAEEIWTRLKKSAFGLATGARRYDPLEPLVAEQQLDQARVQYLDEVISYNRNEFRLYWAMGQPPVSALPGSTAIPLQTPVLPPGTSLQPAVVSPSSPVQPPVRP